MNKEVFEGKWEQIRGEAKVWWGKLTNADLDKVAGQFELFIDLLQEKYGYSRGRTVKEIVQRVAEYEARQKKRIPTL